MKHKVTTYVNVEKRGLFGKKTVREKRVVYVDGRTYRKMKRQSEGGSFDDTEHMLMFDDPEDW